MGTIIDDDKPGKIGFRHDEQTARETDGEFKINLTRSEGSRGDLSVKCWIKCDTAGPGTHYDYKEVSLEYVDSNKPENIRKVEHVGTKDEAGKSLTEVKKADMQDRDFSFDVEFKTGETDAIIGLGLMNNDSFGTCDAFSCALTSKDSTSLMKSNAIIECFIVDNGYKQNQLDTLRQQIEKREEAEAAAERSDWSQQFVDAIEIHPEIDGAGNEVPLTCTEYVMHLFALPWKILFACVPPTHMKGGWDSFGISLMFIAGLTA